MQDKIVTLILQQAAQAEGSTQALASRLNAPEPTLIRWMTGRAQTPLRAFLAVLDFLMQRELKEAAAPETPPEAAQPDKLVFPLGLLFARCERCDGTEFRLLTPGTLRLTSHLTCLVCGEDVVHGNLLARLATEAVHHSRAIAVRTKRAVSASRARLENGQRRLDASVRRVSTTKEGE
jgi:hypothetical protein